MLGSTATTRTPIADGRDRKILYEVNKVHQVDKTKIPGEHTATGESQHFRYQKTGAGGTQTEDGRTDAPRTFTAGVDGKNAADAGSSKNSISKTGETVKGKFSASADQTSVEQRKQNDKTALDYFGRTYKWSETGYVLLNGARLDFSGRHEGGPGGYRSVDHRDIIDALGEDYGGGSYTGGMVRFMQEGNIRISPESGGINLAVMPTKAQMDALGDFISKERGEVILDIDDAQGNTISSTEFSRGTHANKVLQAIRDYFENGTLPQADNTPSVSQFRYSAQDGRYRDLMGEKAAQYVRRLEARMVNELTENLSVPGQAKRKNSLSKNRRGNFSFARYPNNAMDKHDMFGAVHTWHPRDDSNVRPFA